MIAFDTELERSRLRYFRQKVLIRWEKQVSSELSISIENLRDWTWVDRMNMMKSGDKNLIIW